MITPPMGRARNPTAKVPSEARVAASSFPEGKNTCAKTRAEAVP
jgi:hypothetical protein